PRIYDDQVRATVKAIACERPSQLGLPLSRLSLNDIRKAAETQLQRTPGTTTIQGWLSADAIRPWYRRSWIFPRDPQFAEKAAPILDLYRGLWKGKRLDDSDVILSIDEKPVKMVTRRVEPPAAGKTVRYEFEYTRHGVAAYIATLDVRTGKASGIVVKSCTKKVFRSFVTELVRKRRKTLPHNGQRNSTQTVQSTFTGWIEKHSGCTAVFTPVHSSWLNQVEICFSITGRKALTPMNIGGIEELTLTLSNFERYYNSSAGPFNWKFGRKDLKRVLSKLNA
ncbi:MAG: transposase, partial [Nitrososphaerota archaeon]|nr:transposase [Nitrososphaerota archaeon]